METKGDRLVSLEQYLNAENYLCHKDGVYHLETSENLSLGDMFYQIKFNFVILEPSETQIYISTLTVLSLLMQETNHGSPTSSSVCQAILEIQTSTSTKHSLFQALTIKTFLPIQLEVISSLWTSISAY